MTVCRVEEFQPQCEVEVSVEERAALRVLLEEACGDWVMCDYASDEGEDGMLGRVAEGGWGSTMASCFRARPEFTVTETDLT